MKGRPSTVRLGGRPFFRHGLPEWGGLGKEASANTLYARETSQVGQVHQLGDGLEGQAGVGDQLAAALRGATGSKLPFASLKTSAQSACRLNCPLS